VAKSLSYGRVQWLHKEWLAEKPAAAKTESGESIGQLELAADKPARASHMSTDPANDVAHEQTCNHVADDGDAAAVQKDAAREQPNRLTHGDEAHVSTDPAHDVAHEQTSNDVADDDGAAAVQKDAAREQPNRLTDGDEAEATAMAPSADFGSIVTLETIGSSREWVQHLGSWLMLAMLHAMGLYAIAAKLTRDAKFAARLRVALDATAIALSIGQKCVEGLRRLQTPTQWILLRCRGAASAVWARSVLGSFASKDAVLFHAGVAKHLLDEALDDDHRVILYVDNHLRPYTGKHKIRKGWRMQDRKAVPGVSDYYVHDEDGCPLWRISNPSHDSLSSWFRPIIDFVAMALGRKAVPVLIFDRGGSHANALAEIRDLGAEFITYERKPYALLSSAFFTKTLTIRLASKPRQPIVVRFADVADKNLHRGRGRVRRIAVKMPDGEQINVLAASTLPAEIIVRKILARWGCQENQFKHEVERWGINQLDGRTVEDYPEDAVVPNPARRKLEHQLKLAQAAEGRARCALARLAPDDAQRTRLEDDLQRAVDRQDELKKLRPSLPAKAPLKDTSLAGVLVRHPQEYKMVVDTLRIALANAETDLAQRLASHLPRPREAKKMLANLLVAPGKVSVRRTSIAVRLAPAATRREREAFVRFFRHVNRLKLQLPGDDVGRRLHFSLLKCSNH
jgi:hypothetical protein